MPKASYEGAAMANVCRPLQNGLPALRFAVIRRAFGALLLELGSEPARVDFGLLALVRPKIALKTRVLGYLDFCQFSPSPHCLLLSETPSVNSTGVARWHRCGRSHGCLIPVLPREPAALREQR